MRILLIEDEAKTARELQRLILEVVPDALICGVLSGVSESLVWLENHESPDLIFSDIRLADGQCFDIFRNFETPAPVIFCTAFDVFAIEAFQANGIEYLLKPVDKEKLAAGFAKYTRLKRAFSPKSGRDELLRNEGFRQTMLVHSQGKILPLRTVEIAYAYHDVGSVSIMTFHGRRYVVALTLETLELSLDPALFFRANRQCIVNRNAISSVEHHFNRRMKLRLTVNEPAEILVSKTKSPELLRWISRH